MSRNKDQQKPAHRLNTLPDDPPVRKVTIQQKVVQPLNTFVATTHNSDSVRRYPNVVSHDPTGRGHRGKHWAKPTRVVVANIVKDIDRGVGKRKTMDDSVKTGGRVSYTEQRNEERKASEYAHRTADNNTFKSANRTEARLPPVVPPKPKRKKLVESSVSNTTEIPMETEISKQQAGFRNEEKPRNTRSEAKVDSSMRKLSAENRLSESPSSLEERELWENTFSELKEKITKVTAPKTDVRKPQAGFNSEERTPKKTFDTSVTKTSENTQKTDMRIPQTGFNNEERTSEKTKLENLGTKTSEIAAKTDMRKSPAEEKISEAKPEIPFTKTSENTQKSEMKIPHVGLKSEEGTLDKTKLASSETTASEMARRTEIRTAQAEEKTLDNPSGTTCTTEIPKLQAERRTSNSPSLVEERQLWEKAVRELVLTIADKDVVLDNLSKVNRKLSEDIEHYVGKRDRIVGDEHIPYDREGHHMITGDREECQRIIGQHEENIRELENQHRIKSEEFQRIIEEREAQIRGLEHKLHEMRQTDERKGRNSLELSHGSQNVLKTLGLKREKVELEKKVEQLEERLKFYESVSENQPDLQENNTRNIDRKTFHEIPLMLYKFRDGIETKLQENAQVISTLEKKLIKCAENCNTLTELNRNKTQQKRAFEEQILQESIQQVQSIPEIGLEENNFEDFSPGDPTLEHLALRDSNPGDATLRDLSLRESTSGDTTIRDSNIRDSTLGDQTLRDSTLRDLTPEESTLDTAENSSSAKMTSYVENLKNLEAELQKERMINENLMERFIEIEELNNNYLDSIKVFESKAGDSEVLRARNEELRAQNEGLLDKLSGLKEKYYTNDHKDSNALEMKDDPSGLNRDKLTLQCTLESQESEIQELREKLVEDEALIEELREKIVEDEELIEEIRANCQREEKWNREMQRNYEWELSTSAKKDDRIEEFQDCLWARERMVRELQQQLDFEDKRCEELLEKLIVSQKEAEDFQDMCKDLRKKLEDSEKRIKEFCDQNDRDAVAIGNLTSENKQLRVEIENLVKVRRSLEQDLDRVNGCLEAVEADKENFLTKQESEVKKLSDELDDKEYTSKGKDEVIEKLQENVVLLSADVQEMEFKMEEGRLTLEEDLKKARVELTERDKHLAEALEKYRELQEVCKCLRETISEKEGDVLDREAAMAHQREILEGYEKEIESLRRICGDNSTPLNNKPELVYTESEMEEVTNFLEQERTLSEILRKQISFLENEVGEIRASFNKSKEVVEESDKALISARNEIKEYESRLAETRDELSNVNRELTSTNEGLSMANTELSRVKEELISSQKKLDDYEINTTLLQVDLTELNNKYQLLEAIEENTENELMAAKQKLEKLYKEMEGVKLENEDSQRSQGLNKRLMEENERMKQRMEELNMEVRELRMKLNYAREQNEIKKEQVTSDVNALMNNIDEMSDQSWTESSEIDGKLKHEVENQLQSERHVLETELIVRNEEQLKSEVYQNEVEGLSDKNIERGCTKGCEKDCHSKQHLENELQSERHHLKTELNELKQGRKQILDENNELKLSLKELQALNETVSYKNTELQHKVEKLTDKWLRSEENLRQAQVTNVNLRYTLDEYVSESQDQIRHLKNHEREVVTLTEHIHEMDVLVQGFKTSLQEVVNQEDKSDQEAIKNDKSLESNSHLKESGTQSEPCGTPGSTKHTMTTVSPEKVVKIDKNLESSSHLKEKKTVGEPCGTAVTRNNTRETVSAHNSSDSINEMSKDSSLPPIFTANLQNTDSKHANDTNTTSNSQTGLEFMKTIYRKILTAKIPKNVILILIFLILVFCLGCTNNSIISRKYLFVFANSFITLIFFALWVNELHKNKKYKAVDMILGENFNQANLRKDGHQSSQVILQCKNCGSGITIQGGEFHRYAKIKSSFQELHEKFLEAVENSSKDTLPIQELYEKYEKLKDDVEDMRTERLQKDIRTNSVSEIDEVSRNDSLFHPTWNKAATILGKTLVITLLCEVLYIRGIHFLPSAVNLVSYLLSLITFSYFYETICVDPTTREKPCAITREMELEHEIDELNHIIEKEHELVTTQREAIKALEKRLRKEFEKRIKQRNVLLKKLKYKGKLEDLKELLDNDEHDERKGATRNSSSNQQANPNITHMAPKFPEHGNNGERKIHQRLDTAINSNNQIVDMAKQATHGHTGVNKVQGELSSDTSGLDMDNLDTYWDNDKYMEVNENTNKHEGINSTEPHITKELQEIINRAEKGSFDLGFVFSPMFFFLGLPLTGILLSCRYITVPVLMLVIQAALILKETKFIEVENLPKALQKNINPIVLDTIVVLYACILAVFLQCTQSIVVMITCAIVQLAVHWWTSYRLAKREDMLQEISINCLSDCRKHK